MPVEKIKSQQLHAINTSSDIREALEARVKDPLWFLARQWQSGEFEAENGGRPAQVAIATEEYLFESVRLGKQNRKLAPGQPLEAQVEAEDDAGDAPAWRAEALEYSFGLTARGHELEADAYDGRALDWHDFKVKRRFKSTKPARATQNLTMVPNRLTFPGAPDPRWWAMEEGDAYFDSPEDPEPNMLSVLLPEFFYTDVDNWYIAPAPTRAGCLRQITSLRMVDSFGIVTDLEPATGSDPRADWALFGLDASKPGGPALDGSYLMVPNVARYVVENDDVEEVRFMRDEDANLVWAWERRVVDPATGETVSTDTGRTEDGDDPERASGLPEFRLKSPTTRAWIPYVPRRKARSDVLNGQIALRRGRTDETATPENPQYRSKLVAEARHLMEEQIPTVPLRVRRVKRYARGADGEPYFWTARDREVTSRTARPGLRFDYLR